jgi:hypothetical protein
MSHVFVSSRTAPTGVEKLVVQALTLVQCRLSSKVNFIGPMPDFFTLLLNNCLLPAYAPNCPYSGRYTKIYAFTR